jgi:hypothetical protein
VTDESDAGRQEQAQRRFREGVAARADAVEAAKPHVHSGPKIARDPNFPLRVFESAADWVVARDADDALAVLEAVYGEPYYQLVGCTPEDARDELALCDPDRPLSLQQEDWPYRTPERGCVHTAQWPIIWGNYAEEPGEDQRRACHTVQETAPMWWWAQRLGRGLVGSTEW